MMGGAEGFVWTGRLFRDMVLGNVIGLAWGKLGLLLGVCTLQSLMKPVKNEAIKLILRYQNYRLSKPIVMLGELKARASGCLLVSSY